MQGLLSKQSYTSTVGEAEGGDVLVLVLGLVGAGTGNTDGWAVPDVLVSFAEEEALVPAGVAMPIVVGPRESPPTPVPVPVLEVVAVALAADIDGAGA